MTVRILVLILIIIVILCCMYFTDYGTLMLQKIRFGKMNDEEDDRSSISGQSAIGLSRVCDDSVINELATKVFNNVHLANGKDVATAFQQDHPDRFSCAAGSPTKLVMFEIRGWNYEGATGSINWNAFPDTVEQIFIQGTKISGTVALDELPKNVVTLQLRYNKFNKIDLSQAQSKLKNVDLSGNDLTGSLKDMKFDKMPSNVETLKLDNNHIVGNIDLAWIKPELIYLFLGNNQLTGKIRNPKRLSSPMFLRLSGNKLSNCNDLDFKQLSEYSQMISNC